MTLQSFKKNFLASQREHVMNVVSDKTCWVFVTHNVADLQSPASLKDAIEVHWQQEKGGKTGRLHLQGYVRFRFPKSRAQCQEDVAWLVAYPPWQSRTSHQVLHQGCN